MNILNGYKISNSHFKLGSKTHIKDFIYAKRLFQNSFFAHRFAFIVSKYLKQYFNENPNKKTESLTLLGYGEYSQMLINRVERMLHPVVDDINHDMISDVELPALIKGEKLNHNIIIIVPISTTFSTSIKVENMVNDIIKEKGGNSIILQPHINIILVSHNDINDDEYVKELNSYLTNDTLVVDSKYEPYKLFNWRHVDNINKKVTTVTNSTDKSERLQKYFISIPSEWYLMDSCELCIPIDNLLKEIPLLETDKASVTPDLLLELPKSFNNNTQYAVTDIVLNQNAIYSGHIEYLDSHYLHYIKPVDFFREYELKIIEWAKQMKNKVTIWDNLFQSKVLLISPSRQSNTYFVELINRYVFEDSATVIHYEVLGDFVENYQKFFGEVINASDYIFYIDDFIQSGRTFQLINDFVKFSRKLDNNVGACHGIFTLINKSDYYAYSDILSHLNQDEIDNDKKFFSFFDVKIKAIQKDNCPLCKEQERYKELFDNSMLDTIRHFFLNKQVKLNTKDINAINRARTGWYKYHPLVNEKALVPWETNDPTELQKWEAYSNNLFPDKQYLKLIIQHELNNLLSHDEELRIRIGEDISDLSQSENYRANESLFTEIKIKLLASQSFTIINSKLNIVSQKILSQLCEHLIIKVFTLHPFINIKTVRQKVFSWVLIELEKTLDRIIKNEALLFKDFRYFKFLLRRATLMGSNYLIRKETLDKIRLIYKKYSKEKKEIIETERVNKVKYFKKLLDVEIKTFENYVDKLIEIEELIYNKESALIGDASSFKIVEEIEVYKQERNIINTSSILSRNKIDFLKQALDNITYKETSLSEVSYFYVALIKELTIHNESKVLILERNLELLSKDIDKNQEGDFAFLIRLIQFENVSLISQALRIIVEEYLPELNQIDNPENVISFSHKFSEGAIRDQIREVLKKALNDYRLSSFKKFIRINDFEEWTKTDEYIVYTHVLYIIGCLLNEERNPCKIPLEDKTKAIIQNIYRIAGYPNFKNDNTYIDENNRMFHEYIHDGIDLGGFISIRFKGDNIELTNPEDILVAQATSEHVKTTGPSLLKVEIDSESLSYFLLNGISGRGTSQINDIIGNFQSNIYEEYPLKPWTILEITLQENEEEKFWKSNRGKIFPVIQALKNNFTSLMLDEPDGKIKYGFTENLHIKGEPKQMLFFRIANIFEENGKIKNIGQAVICLFNNEESFDIYRVRLLLLIRKYLLAFIKTHFDNDSLTAFVKEKIKLKEAERLKHGYIYYLNGLYALAEGAESYISNDDIKECSKLYKDLVVSGPILYSIISEIDYYKSKGERIDSEYWQRNNMPLVEYDALALSMKFEKMTNMIFGTKNFGNAIDTSKSYFYRGINNCKGNQKVVFPDTLVDILFAEILINAKKNFPKEEKYLYFEINDDENGFGISVSNNYKYKMSTKKLLRVNKNNVKYNTNGLGLIKRITGLLCDKYATVKQEYKEKYDQELFELCFTIKNMGDA